MSRLPEVSNGGRGRVCEEMERLLVRVETDEWIYEEFEFI
jgi:hypothetical protein